jgi:hypothetical protein
MTSASAGGALVPLLTLTNTATTGSVAMEIYKNKPTAVASGDVLFNQSVFGKDSGNAKQEYTRITHTIRDGSSTTEDGSIEFNCFTGGAIATFLQINGIENEINCLKTIDLGTTASIRSSAGNIDITANASTGTGNVAITAKGDVDITSNGAGGSVDVTAVSSVNITATGDNLALTAGATMLLDSDDLRFTNSNVVTTTPNHTSALATTGNISDITTYLKVKLNNADIWIPYFTVDPNV